MARRRTNRSTTASIEAFHQHTPPSAEDVARRAYEIYEARGAQPGADLDDWLQAERELSSTAAPDATEERAALAEMMVEEQRPSPGVVNDSTMET